MRRKLTALLHRRGLAVAHPPVDRATREQAMCGVRRVGVPITVPGKDGVRAFDVLDRNFSAEVPNRCGVADFTRCSSSWQP